MIMSYMTLKKYIKKIRLIYKAQNTKICVLSPVNRKRDIQKVGNTEDGQEIASICLQHSCDTMTAF